MDFAFNEQQEMLRKSASDFLSKEYSDKVLARMARDEKGYTSDLWNKMAELGWMALSIPEDCGGMGDFLDLCIILEEMGRVGLISPYFATMVLGVSALVEAGDEEQKRNLLSAIAEGKLNVTLAMAEAPGRSSQDAIQTKAEARNGNYVINGAKLFVPDAATADYIICAARTNYPAQDSGSLTLFLVETGTSGVQINPLKIISGEKQSEVVFNDVEVPAENILGKPGKGGNYLEKVLERAAAGRCAEAAGGAKRVLDMTLTYAKERAAFGHPIGAYQAVQHLCANMLIDVEGSRLVTYQAAWALNQGLPSGKEAEAARVWVGPAYCRVVTSAHQVHGAIGFTEDHVLHWYTRRAKATEVYLGNLFISPTPPLPAPR